MTRGATFEPTNEHVVVNTNVVGPRGTKNLQVALDTGAAHSAIDAKVAAELFDLEVATPIEVLTVTGLSDAHRIRSHSISALGKTIDEFDLLALPMPEGAKVAGLLGLDFLRGSKLTIDFDAGEITLD